MVSNAKSCPLPANIMDNNDLKAIEDLRELLHNHKIVNVIRSPFLQNLKNEGFYIDDDYLLTKKYKDYYLIIDFCPLEFLVGIYSKNSKKMLETERRFDTFLEALIAERQLEFRIDDGEHWEGENL